MEKFEKLSNPSQNFEQIYKKNIINNPKIIIDMYYHPDYFTLANGLLPWIIIMRNRELNNLGNYDIEIHNLLKNKINRTIIEQIKDPGLFNGLSGLTYILAISSKNGRYDNLIEGTLPYLEYQTYDKISECIRNKNNKTVNDYDYDLISGLSGILKCYLNKHVIKYIQDKKVIDDIAICLADYFNFKEYNNLQSLPFYIKNQKNEYINSEGEMINLSHSHGIMGILSALNQYYKTYHQNDIKKTIEKICDFVAQYYCKKSRIWIKRHYNNQKKYLEIQTIHGVMEI
ncbi:TPA: lanthionine synthetase LanC family protein [Staphylococcus aureus]